MDLPDLPDVSELDLLRMRGQDSPAPELQVASTCLGAHGSNLVVHLSFFYFEEYISYMYISKYILYIIVELSTGR